ncbi:ABC transporter ATP-binding protein [Mycobacterium sp. 21AC1]|uniref:ABC transporter ATP-binding protein n=1 Tax=[Mycobacterium] appelbergii TaxID=2939269 RepID=UPI00293946FD|nr:ABC transporter ATP-binding protein [Mycobacterium sp. 21AC1]MDV3125976.1 ABC transporter ATP-binding protein [Mycobacterium sp. 21AC1]
MTRCVLEVDDLRVGVGHMLSPTLVDGVTLRVHAGECLGLVGESGSGKSLTLRSMLGLLPPTLQHSTGGFRFADADGTLRTQHPRDLRGRGVSMVFQEPMSSLNPTMRVGDLVSAGCRANGMSRKAAAGRAVELLAEVGVPDPRRRCRAWPHELSGGLRQRVMIAMALSVEPRLLLCDEPTTALDVTVQDQILALIERLRSELDLAVIFVSHDLGVIARVADRTAVMYAGRIVEEGPTREVVDAPRHPYTRGLVESVPRISSTATRLATIPGNPPAAGHFPAGCRFAPRCELAEDACRTQQPPLTDSGENHSTACLRHSLLTIGQHP